MSEFFVIIAGQPKVADSEILLFEAVSAAQAHKGAAAEFRRKRGLAPNVHVLTRTAHRTDSEETAMLFVAVLLARLDKKEAGTVEDHGDSSGG